MRNSDFHLKPLTEGQLRANPDRLLYLIGPPKHYVGSVSDARSK
jgi:hypothetical protein